MGRSCMEIRHEVSAIERMEPRVGRQLICQWPWQLGVARMS